VQGGSHWDFRARKPMPASAASDLHTISTSTDSFLLRAVDPEYSRSSRIAGAAPAPTTAPISIYSTSAAQAAPPLFSQMSSLPARSLRRCLQHPLTTASLSSFCTKTLRPATMTLLTHSREASTASQASHAPHANIKHAHHAPPTRHTHPAP